MRALRILAILALIVGAVVWGMGAAQAETLNGLLSDLGRGITSVGLGLLLALFILTLWTKVNENKRYLVFCTLWLSLWVLKMPLTFFCYGTRGMSRDLQARALSDSRALVFEFPLSILGSILTLFLLLLLLRNHRLPANLRLWRPRQKWEYVRFVIIDLWIAFLLLCIIPSIADGDSVMIIPCIAAIPLLLLIESSETRQIRLETPVN